MSRRDLLRTAALAPIALPGTWSEPPKVLVVVWDDVGWDLVAESYTPALDQLQAIGRTYTRFWAGPRCSNARARFISGLESWRPGNLVGWGLAPGSTYELPATSQSLAARVPGASAFRGKWHLAPDSRVTHPIECGFGAWSGTMRNLGSGGETFYNWMLWSDQGSVPQSAYATQKIASLALEDVRDGVDLVVCSLPDCHKPWDVPPEYLAPSTFVEVGAGGPWSTRDIGRAKVEAADTVTGRLVAEALNRGYVVMLWSDNGTSDNVLPSGGKDSLFERGLNVPLVIAGPTGIVEPGYSEALIQVTDLHETITEIRGGVPYHPPALDSVSFHMELAGLDAGVREFNRADMWAPSGSPPPLDRDRAVRGPRYKLEAAGGEEWMYDLVEDGGEDDNLLDGGLTSEEQAAYADLKAEMETMA